MDFWKFSFLHQAGQTSVLQWGHHYFANPFQFLIITPVKTFFLLSLYLLNISLHWAAQTSSANFPVRGKSELNKMLGLVQVLELIFFSSYFSNIFKRFYIRERIFANVPIPDGKEVGKK